MKEIIELRKKREKHFENGDGTITAYMYNDDVHYLDNGKFKEIDNTIIEKDNHYENKENEFKVIFNKESDDLLDIHKEGHYLKLYLNNNQNLTLNKKDEIMEYTDGNIEIDYKVIGSKVKESIILKDKENIPDSLEFTIDTNLDLNLLESGTIEAKCEDNLVFLIDKAFMIDNESKINNNIKYELTKEENYKLKLDLDKEWLIDEETNYPVIIDPTIINSGKDNNNVFDTYISSMTPTANSNNNDTLFTGILAGDNYFDIRRTLMKFVLPEIGTGFNIVNAELMLTHTNMTYAIGSMHPKIEIHALNCDWDEYTATWETMNNKYNERIEALFQPEVYYYGGDPRVDYVDITNLVKSWYSGNPNYGFMLKAVNEIKEDDVYSYRIWSKTYDAINETTKRPFLSITYIRQNGLRNEMTYTNLKFSNGATSINNYTGNITNVFSINKTISNKFPVVLDIVYSTEDILNSKDKEIAAGWKLGLVETLEETHIDVTDYLLYRDKTNADHYFYKLEENKYRDEEGLNLTINYKDNIYEMLDSNNNKKIFSKMDGKILLTKVIDVQDNEINIIYDNGKITKVKDGNNEEANISYTENLITITTSYDVAKINISNNILTSIETKTGKVEFNYNVDNLITKIIDINKMSVGFEYYDMSPYKIHKVVNYGLNSTVGQILSFEYDANSTSITDNEGRKTVYIFDEQGRTLNNIMYAKGNHKMSESYVNENTYYFYPEFDIPGFEKFENKKNKLTSSNPSIKYIDNLLLNSGFEGELSKCNFQISSGERRNNNVLSGDYCLRIAKESNLTFDILEENDYTLSFYMSLDISQLDSILNISLYQKKETEEILIDSFHLNDADLDAYHYDYRRYSFSGHFSENSKMILKLSTGMNSFIYLDDLQLEKGLVANVRNLVENSSFEYGTQGWTINSNSCEVVALDSGEKALKINNNPSKEYSISQTLKIDGKAGESYRLSFWYKNEGVIKYPYEIEGVLASLAVYPVDTENEGGCIPLTGLDCNSKEWQYYSATFTTDFDYTDANLLILSLCEANSLYVTNFMIIKDPRYTSYDYDKEGNLTSSKNLNNETTTLKYDNNNQMISNFNPKGNNYKYEYDNIKTDRVLKGISPTGISNEIKYNENGNPVKTIINNVNPEGVIVGNGNYHIRLKGTNKYLSCNYSDNVINLLEENCNKQYFKLTKVEDYYRLKVGYKNLTLVNDKIVLSSLENDYSLFEISITDNGSYKITPKIKTNATDLIGVKDNQLSLLSKDETGNNTFYFEDIDTPLYIENKSYYTSDGKFVTCVSDALGKETHYENDENTGLVTSVTNAKGEVTSTNYDSKGKPISITTNNKTVNYSYNEHNMLSKIISGTKEYNFTYDNFLNTKTIKIGNNILVENNYDEKSNLLKSSTYGNGAQISYTYDELDRVKKLTKGNKEYTYHYDNFGNIAKILSSDEKYTYSYDLGQRLLNYVYKDSNNEFRINLDYDSNNNVTKKTYLINNMRNYNISYEYNKDDSVIKVVLDNNTINYDYDYLGRLKSKNINNHLKVEYTYITNGNKTSLVLNTMKIDNDIYKYIYDDLYNITHIYLNNELINEYEYDNINELITERDYLSNKSYKYVYDEEGNIEKKQEFTLDTHILIKEDTYEYNNSNWEDQLTKFNNETITYDEIGNPLTIGNATLTWENGRQLNSYTKDNLNISYTYNIDGIRTSKTVNGITTKYYVEGTHILFEKTGTNMIYYIRDENGELIGLKHNSDTYFYKKNYQGDIIGIYDSTYNLIVNYKYDSWGNIISIADNNGNTITNNNHIGLINPFRYRSYYYDTETKLYYLNSRYYNPLWRRFINSDLELGNDILGDNLYLYCGNNPNVRIDSKGSGWVFGCAFIGGCISATVQMGMNLASGKNLFDDTLGAFAGGFVAGGLFALGVPTLGTALGAVTTTVINTSLDAVSKAKENKGNNQAIKEIAKDYSKDVVVDSITSAVSSVAASKLVGPVIDKVLPPIKAGRYPESLPGFIKGKRGQQFMGSTLMDSVISGEVSEAMSPVVKWGIQQIPKLIIFV